MNEILTWSVLVPVAGYWFLILSPFRFMTALQSGYHLFFRSLFAGVVSMCLVSVGIDVYQGNELFLLPETGEEFLYIWVIDVALVTLIFGTMYIIDDKLISKEKRTRRELEIADKLGEKIVCFLGKAMINYKLVQLSIGNGRSCIGYVTKIPTPLPVRGIPSTAKEVSFLLIRYEFLDFATGEITKQDAYKGEIVRKEDHVEMHLPLSQVEFAGLYGDDEDIRRLADGG